MKDTAHETAPAAGRDIPHDAAHLHVTGGAR